MARRLANKRRVSLPGWNTIMLCAEEHHDRILGYKQKLEDERYINLAIDKIAQEITHFLVK